MNKVSKMASTGTAILTSLHAAVGVAATPLSTRPTSPQRGKRALVAAALCGLAACGGGAGDGIDRSGAPHMRPAEQGASSAVYFMLRNPGPDTLVLRGVEIDVAGAVMIHRSVDANGMNSMVHVDSVIVLPNDSVAFAERGLHIMASDLHSALRLGDTVVARLQFRPARVDTLRIPVRE